ncbi:unnamed protein product [Trichogramma brassicae]|uniref:Reverse transcriptase domain-containing protein n=1 Tax=Trichogramma brassicae TaxID=86971 RepID=A0A6H5HVU2_9HYME|nr:unnamed protein product [Trichogramma brassicae]
MSRLGSPQAKQPSSPLLLVRGAVAALFLSAGAERARPVAAASSGGAYTGRHLWRNSKELGRRSRSAHTPRPGWHTQLSAQDRYCRDDPTSLCGCIRCVWRPAFFPSGWKRQRLVLLPKPGKPPDEPSSYRPRCMLDTAGQDSRENHMRPAGGFHRETPEGLSERQYGFRKGRSTIDAIEDVISVAREAIAGKSMSAQRQPVCDRLPCEEDHAQTRRAQKQPTQASCMLTSSTSYSCTGAPVLVAQQHKCKPYIQQQAVSAHIACEPACVCESEAGRMSPTRPHMSLPAYHRWPFSRTSERGTTAAAAERTQRTRNRLATLSKWQEAWDRSKKARWTHRLIPNIRVWIERRHGELNYHLTQLLTGHGFFKHHSRRYDYNQSAQCPVCPSSIENAEHVFYHCPRFSEERESYTPCSTRQRTAPTTGARLYKPASRGGTANSALAKASDASSHKVQHMPKTVVLFFTVVNGELLTLWLHGSHLQFLAATGVIELREVVIRLSVPPLNPRNDVRDESVRPPTLRRAGPFGLPFLDRPSSFFTPNVFEAAMIQPRALVDE